MATRSNRGSSGTRGGVRSGSEAFLNVSWTTAIDSAYEKWAESQGRQPTAKLISGLVQESLNIKIGTHNGSVFATIESPIAKESDSPYLLSGWADTWEEAVMVAYYKWDQLIARDFAHPTLPAATSRRR